MSRTDRLLVVALVFFILAFAPQIFSTIADISYSIADYIQKPVTASSVLNETQSQSDQRDPTVTIRSRGHSEQQRQDPNYDFRVFFDSDDVHVDVSGDESGASGQISIRDNVWNRIERNVIGILKSVGINVDFNR